MQREMKRPEVKEKKKNEIRRKGRKRNEKFHIFDRPQQNLK